MGAGRTYIIGSAAKEKFFSFLNMAGRSVSGRTRKSPRTPCGATIRPTVIHLPEFISFTESDDLSVFHQNFSPGDSIHVVTDMKSHKAVKRLARQFCANSQFSRCSLSAVSLSFTWIICAFCASY